MVVRKSRGRCQGVCSPAMLKGQLLAQLSAPLTPVLCLPAGDKVTAGTVNYDGQITVQAVHSGGDTGAP